MTQKKHERFTRYDTADYLKDEASISAYLEAAKEEAVTDPALIAVAIDNVARARSRNLPPTPAV